MRYQLGIVMTPHRLELGYSYTIVYIYLRLGKSGRVLNQTNVLSELTRVI